MHRPTTRITATDAPALRLLPRRDGAGCDCRGHYWHAPGDCGASYTCATNRRDGTRICGSCYVNCDCNDSARHD